MAAQINEASAGSAGLRYWVVGGLYTDTNFTTLIDGGPQERIGPFASYKAALSEWSRLAWRSVDNCHARYHIEAEASANSEATG